MDALISLGLNLSHVKAEYLSRKSWCLVKVVVNIELVIKVPANNSPGWSKSSILPHKTHSLTARRERRRSRYFSPWDSEFWNFVLFYSLTVLAAIYGVKLKLIKAPSKWSLAVQTPRWFLLVDSSDYYNYLQLNSDLRSEKSHRNWSLSALSPRYS